VAIGSPARAFAQVRLREKLKEDSADPFASRESQIPGMLPACGHSNTRTSAGSSSFLVVREWHPACGKYYWARSARPMFQTDREGAFGRIAICLTQRGNV